MLASAVCARKKGTARKRPVRTKSRVKKSSKMTPLAAIRLARCGFFSPRARDNWELMPTPMPVLKAIISDCSGKARLTVASASSLIMETKTESTML